MSKFMEIKKDNKYVLCSKRTKVKLGEISYFDDWGKFVFEPEPNTVYDAQCLKDIIDWLDNIAEGKL